MIRDSKSPVVFKTAKHRVVVSGTWICPYTGKVFHLASDVDIDHIVPLGAAYSSGGDLWTREQRQAFANDPENLLAVEDNANQSKGQRSPVQWRPARRTYWAVYALKWIHIKEKYRLTYSPLELRALGYMLGGWSSLHCLD